MLKDNKNYPYIKVTVNEEFPRVVFTRKRISDAAKYFGPYSGAGKAMSIIKTTQRAFALPQCKLNFPQDIVGIKAKNSQIDKFDELPNLLNELNRQVSEVDGNVTSLVAFKENLDVERRELEEARVILEENRFAFEQQMKQEYQKLNDLKIDFEQEKTKVFNDIQGARERLEKNKRVFEKYRQEQINMIEKNKKLLTRNYEQFEKIVSVFNEKIEKFETNNK